MIPLLLASAATAAPEPVDRPRHPERFSETLAGVGALHAPADPSARPAETTGVLRLFTISGVPRVPHLAFANDTDLRGVETIAWHTSTMLGFAATDTDRRSLAALVGLGGTGRGLCFRAYCPPDHVGSFQIPVRAVAGVRPGGGLELVVRGGADFVLLSDFDAPTVEPDVVVGVGWGDRASSVRLEGGYRSEFGADTWTGLAAFVF
jgi:hypothetical protein